MLREELLVGLRSSAEHATASWTHAAYLPTTSQCFQSGDPRLQYDLASSQEALLKEQRKSAFLSGELRRLQSRRSTKITVGTQTSLVLEPDGPSEYLPGVIQLQAESLQRRRDGHDAEDPAALETRKRRLYDLIDEYFPSPEPPKRPRPTGLVPKVTSASSSSRSSKGAYVD